MERITKSWSFFQNPSRKTACSAPWRTTDDDVISDWQLNLVISETIHADKSYYGSLSRSHGRPFRICHEKSREAPPGGEILMTSYTLAIKPRYLGNNASQIKSYYVTLSGSHGRSFRIRHKKLRLAPSGGEVMLTSYPVCNKTSLSRKPCVHTFSHLTYFLISVLSSNFPT